MSEDCSQLTECHGAYKCFSAIVRDDRGVVKKSKGCAKNPQQTSLYCGTKSYDGKVSHAIHQKSAQYAFSCCRGDFCNNGTWPILPPVPKLKKRYDRTGFKRGVGFLRAGTFIETRVGHFLTRYFLHYFRNYYFILDETETYQTNERNEQI